MCIDASDGIARGERDGDLVDSVYAKRSRFNQLLGREFPISFGKSGTGFGGQWRFGVFRGGGGGGLSRSDERDRGRRVERFRINASGRACNSI